MQQLLPEWHSQEAIILTWPDAQTDWQPWLEEVRLTYLSIIAALNNNNTPVILLVRPSEINQCQQRLSSLSNTSNITSVLLIAADINDTWVRDYGFLTCALENQLRTVNFTFNGWGNKFNAELDNQINQQIFSNLVAHPMQTFDFVLEGGALEINEAGHLLTTQLCLANPERNGVFDSAQNRQQLQQALGAKQITILEHGHLEGDDTDGHIDTLVRFAPNNTLVIQSCANRPDDSHYQSLSALVAECRAAFPTYKLIELPLVAMYSKEGERLPASYANYLINNNQILFPVYGEPEDPHALAQIQLAYPNMNIVAINCRPLVQQFGSLHCISMQVPTGTLKPNVIAQANSGVNIYVAS